MNKQTIVSVIIIIIFVGLLVAFGGSRSGNRIAAGAASAPAASGAALTLSEEKFDLGQISMERGVVTHAVTITNSGTEAVALSRLYTSCMCTEATLTTKAGSFGPFGMPGHGFTPSLDASILPGEEATLTVRFDPAAHGPAGVGEINREVVLQTAGGQSITATFHATVTP